MPTIQAQSDNYIVFSSDRDGSLNIYVMNADGRRVRRLTDSSAQDIDPVWSPDRRRIAFVSNRDGNFSIYIMNANGDNAHRITPDDSNYYAAPAWSPDGRYLALVSDRTGNLEIHTIGINGNNLQALTNDPDEDNEPHWSPDGSRIAFSSYRSGFGEIYVMNITGGSPQQLTSGSGADNLSPVWSPDGRQIAFVANEGLYSEIYVMTADGLNEEILITIDDYFIDSPTWSSDGQFIAYQVSKPQENATIRSVRVDGQEAQQLTSADYNSKWPAWSTAQGGSVNLSGTDDNASTSDNISCSDSSASRLTPGTQARVTPGLPNRLRESPSLQGRELGTIPAGGVVDVLDGPACANGYTWWQVRYRGQTGWTAEGPAGEHWLEPLSSTNNASNPPSDAPNNAGSDTCNGRSAQFNVGDSVVVSEIGDGLRILTQPSGGARNAIGQAVPGDILEIQSGPVCTRLGAYNQDTWYWYVYSYADNRSGWVAEGPTTERWICPVDDPQCDR